MSNYIAGIEEENARGDEDIIADGEFSRLSQARAWLVGEFDDALFNMNWSAQERSSEISLLRDEIDNHDFKYVDFFYTGPDKLVYFILQN